MSVLVASPSLEKPSWLGSHASRTTSSISVSKPHTIDVACSPSCITTSAVRCHREERKISEGAQAARQTWLEIVPDAQLRSHSAGPFGNFFAITWPTGKTERVKLATEIIETLWLYDDLAEDIPHSKAVEVHAKLSDSLEADKIPEKPSRKTLMMGLFHDFAARLMDMDKEGAPRVIDALKSYLQNYDSKKGEFPAIDEYTEFRILNVGFWIMESFMQWTMGICLTETEQEACHEFCLSAGRAMGLTNDLYSWNVERNDPADRQWNAVPVIKKQYNLSEDDAIVLLKGLIVGHEQETRRLGLDIRKRFVGSNKMAKYLDAMGMMLGGNCFWSSNCPRYNPELAEEATEI